MSKTGASRSSVLITMVSNNVPGVRSGSKVTNNVSVSPAGITMEASLTLYHVDDTSIEERLRSPFPVFSMSSSHTEVWS